MTTETIENDTQLRTALERHLDGQYPNGVGFEIALIETDYSFPQIGAQHTELIPVLRVSPNHLLAGSEGTVESAIAKFHEMREFTLRSISHR